jgi:hypothetical protein
MRQILDVNNESYPQPSGIPGGVALENLNTFAASGTEMENLKFLALFVHQTTEFEVEEHYIQIVAPSLPEARAFAQTLEGIASHSHFFQIWELK